MSSGNLISIVYTKETEYGVGDTPLNGLTAETVRYTSESLSGTPLTTESQEVRSDRMSSGQVAVGLEVGGGIDFELSSDVFHDDWQEAAMMSTWSTPSSLATDVTLTPLTSQTATLTVTGDLSTIPVTAGDMIQLVPATGMPVTVVVISVESTTDCTVATEEGEAAIAAVAMDVVLGSYVDVGALQRSFHVGKSYLDVLHEAGSDVHSQTYGGSLVSTLTIAAQYGEIMSGSYGSLGNSYVQEAPSYEQQITTAGGTINPAGTSQALNASLDFPVVTIDGEPVDFCIESVTLNLDNGLDPSNCIGEASPSGYTLGTAAVTVDMSAYLGDSSYDALMAKKLSQEPLSFSFTATNSDGGYGYTVAAMQLSFPDPSSSGLNTQTMIEASGTGKVGANGESSLRIYKLLGEQV